jgi:hypothetical protein
MQPDERKLLITQYQDGYRAVAAALVKITPEELDAKPGPGKWSAREIVHHLGDKDRFAGRLHYERPHEASLELFRTVRASTAELMGCLTEADWLREGTHSEVGRFGLDTWLRVYGPHAHRHADQILVARSAAVKK